MAIAKNIVTMMDGDIKVESKLGEGSKFTVRVFLTIQELNETDTASLGSLKILVADDDQMSAESTREILNGIGMDATSVYGGEEASGRRLEMHVNVHVQRFAHYVESVPPVEVAMSLITQMAL